MATLAVYRGEQLLRKVELGETPMRIGRAPENEIVLEDTNKGVSRMHAEIRYEDGRYVILDLNSQNGVWIQEHRVRVDPIPVDVPVTVGPYRLVLLPAPSHSSATSIPGTVISSLPESRRANRRRECRRWRRRGPRRRARRNRARRSRARRHNRARRHSRQVKRILPAPRHRRRPCEWSLRGSPSPCWLLPECSPC